MRSDGDSDELALLTERPPHGGLRIVDLDALESVFDRRAILASISDAFIAQYQGRFIQAEPVHMTFDGGDCHVKSGFAAGADSFLIKVATGFYGNARLGLPNANGLMLLMSQRTGEPLALLRDRGMLTAWRTVAATVIAAQLACPAGPLRMGIVGAGLQAELTAQWMAEECEVASIKIWSRSLENAKALAQRTGASPEADLEALCRASNLIVTVTPSTLPLIRSDWIAPGTHLVGVGADTPGKIEIDPALLARADAILTDSHEQCLDHGDFGAAVRAGFVPANADITLGQVLAEQRLVRSSPADITFADLTGLSVQDAAIADLFVSRLDAKAL